MICNGNVKLGIHAERYKLATRKINHWYNRLVDHFAQTFLLSVTKEALLKRLSNHVQHSIALFLKSFSIFLRI